jgi:hypothetical protein
MASAESAAGVPETVSVAETALPEPRGTMDRRLLDELWRASDVPSWGLERDEFDRIIADAGIAQNFGLDAGVAATRRQQAEFFRGLRLTIWCSRAPALPELNGVGALHCSAPPAADSRGHRYHRKRDAGTRPG